MSINRIGQKDLEKLYWERDLETPVVSIHSRSIYVANRTSSRHTSKYIGVGYFIGVIPLSKLVIGV